MGTAAAKPVRLRRLAEIPAGAPGVAETRKCF